MRSKGRAALAVLGFSLSLAAAAVACAGAATAQFLRKLEPTVYVLRAA